MKHSLPILLFLFLSTGPYIYCQTSVDSKEESGPAPAEKSTSIDPGITLVAGTVIGALLTGILNITNTIYSTRSAHAKDKKKEAINALQEVHDSLGSLIQSNSEITLRLLSAHLYGTLETPKDMRTTLDLSRSSYLSRLYMEELNEEFDDLVEEETKFLKMMTTTVADHSGEGIKSESLADLNTQNGTVIDKIERLRITLADQVKRKYVK